MLSVIIYHCLVKYYFCDLIVRIWALMHLRYWLPHHIGRLILLASLCQLIITAKTIQTVI